MSYRVLSSALALVLTGCPKHESVAGETSKVAASPQPAGHFAGRSDASPLTSANSKLPAAFTERAAEREAFVQATIADRDVTDPRVLAVMRKVPRHRFAAEEYRSAAYSDRPLPIVGGQTISQPYIVAFMTEAARPTTDSKCLEIGTGSGYQAAVLAELCRMTFSIEYLPAVAEFGRKNLRRLGYGEDRLALRVGDGYAGWPEQAPFDVILVTAAPESVPEPLLDQLAVGGRLILPVGPNSEVQTLERWTRRAPGRGQAAFERERLMGVRFVPFLGEGTKGR